MWVADKDKTGLPAGLAWQLLPPFLLVKNWQDRGCGAGLQWPYKTGICSLLVQVRKLRQRQRLIFLTLQKGLELLMRPLPSALCWGVVQACPCPGGAQLGYASSRLCGGGSVCSGSVCSPAPHTSPRACVSRAVLHNERPPPPASAAKRDGSQRRLVAKALLLSKRDPVSSPGPAQLLQFGSSLESSELLPAVWHRTQTLSSERGPGIKSKPLERETEAKKGRGPCLRTLGQNPTVPVLNPGTGLTVPPLRQHRTKANCVVSVAGY